MKNTFTEMGENQQRSLDQALADDELSFVPLVADVLPNTEALSVFTSLRILDDRLGSLFGAKAPSAHLP